MTRYVPTGTYMGEDLQGRSARPGAYDAMAIPSRMGERRLLPAEMKAELRATPTAAVPLPARSATSRAVPAGEAAAPIPPTPPRPEPVAAPAVVTRVASPLPAAEQAPPRWPLRPRARCSSSAAARSRPPRNRAR